MSAFTVELDNQPGELARLCEAMASSGVNLLLCATTYGGSGVVAFIADDEAAAQAVLDGAGIGYLMRPAVTVRMLVSTWTCSCRSASQRRSSTP